MAIGVKACVTSELAIAAGKIAAAHPGESITLIYEDTDAMEVWTVVAGGEVEGSFERRYEVTDDDGRIELTHHLRSVWTVEPMMAGPPYVFGDRESALAFAAAIERHSSGAERVEECPIIDPVLAHQMIREAEEASVDA